jgi:hypothetical protein
MKHLVIIFSCLLITASSFCQKFRSDKGLISFFSDGVIEDISAENIGVGSLFNSTTGELVFIVPIKDFKFQKSLMREHFNEKYMETDKYPKSTFQGKLIGYSSTITGEQKVKAVGKLTLHGVSKDIDVPGTVEIGNDRAAMKSKFKVKLKDYNIKIPTIVWQNIAEEVEIKIDFTYKKL